MTLAKVIEKNTIKFQKSLSLSDTEDLLLYIAIHLPGEVSYTTTYKNVVYNRKVVNSSPETEEALGKKRMSVSIEGIISGRDISTFDHFKCEPSMKNPVLLDSIKFFTIPGYDLNDYDPNVVKLWAKVGKMVSNYFESKKIK